MSKKLICLISFVLVLCLFGNAWGLVWGQKDIGNPAIPGSASEVAGTWTIQGSGHDIWGNSDGFYYVYRPLSGDGSLQLNLVSMDVTSIWAKVGPAIRETLEPGSKHAMTAMTGANGIQFVWRVNTNQSSDDVVRGGEFPPKELRITRSGDWLISEFNYEWLPGLFMWTEIGRMAIPMNTDVTIGIVVCATNNGALNTAVIDNVVLTAPPYEKPWDFSPADGSVKLPLTQTLSWLPGDSAASHDVYFGTDPAALALVATKALGDESYTPYTPLDEGTVYYWQIVEQPLGQAGPIMSFKTERTGTGFIDYCIWFDIGGTAVVDLTSHPRYPDDPTMCGQIDVLDSGTDVGDNYGGRAQGFLVPETSGDYTFWIAADDGCELWLSPSEKACEAVKICYWTGWTDYHAYDSHPEQKSAAIPLVGGQKYFIRVLWKEGSNKDHCSVAWEGPDSPSRTEIDGYYLMPGYVELDASNPNPADGATDVPLDVVLSWLPGASATSHDVYLGADPAALVLVATKPLGDESYIPDTPLDEDTVYYWQIVEQPGDRTCPVWCFTTTCIDYCWYTYNGHQYVLTMDFGNWQECEAEAQSVGGHLVTINDANEHAWLGLEFEQQLDQDNYLWIGFYQDHNDPDYSEPAGGWKWISGQPVTYLGWAPPEPTNHPPGEDYGTITRSTTNYWNDWGPNRPDFHPIRGIIEIFEPPIAICQDVTVEADSNCQGIVLPEDVNDGSFDPNGDAITLSLEPAGPYPLGETSVTLMVSDGIESATCEATVTVEDVTPPEITCPAGVTVEQESYAGTVVALEATATDNCDANPVITSDELAIYPLGVTIVTFTATDVSGNSASCSMTVTVIDTTAPTINSVSAGPDVLWPPNHKMVEVVVVVDAEDICDPAPVCEVVNVTSNEPINGPGDGKTEPDWEITGDLTVNLRAERAGAGSGRVYTIYIECTDASGNTTAATAEVNVPHDQG